MNCRKVRSYLSTFSEDSRSSEMLSEMEVHIRTCKSCEREKFYLDEILAAARSMPTKTVPDDFNLKLFNRIYAEQNSPSESYLPTEEVSWIRRPVSWVSALATVAVAALITIVFIQRTSDSPDMQLNRPAFSQADGVTPASNPTLRRVSSRTPASEYENIIGVSGAVSNYRATNMSQVKSLHLADAKIESLYIEAMRRLGAEPYASMVSAEARYYNNLRSTAVRARGNGSPLVRNAASTVSY
jgi:hypothetical protein